jgi:serine/threonine-protein kinase
MSDPPNRGAVDLPQALTLRADQECDHFEAAWQAGQRPRIEDHLAAVPEAERPALLQELILLEVDYRRMAGDHPAADEFLARFPTLDSAWIASVLARTAPSAIDLDSLGMPVRRVAPRPLGKFLLLQLLGKGGCGTVWRAQDTELDRVVAVKIPHTSLLTSPGLRERFRREARAAAQLSHPNIVTLFEVTQVEDTPLLVMEYVEGTNLGRLVEQSGPLPVRQACDCIRQAALGLQHAHERGLVHRDVKPANLLLTAPSPARASAGQGVVKVLDLGLARLPRRPADADSSLTEPGCLMGTADFMAPEQGRDARTADARADVYSLGCSLYYLLTARLPFPGGTASEKLLRHHLEEPAPLEQLQPAVSPALAAVVRKMMARHPADRYQTAAEVAIALTAVHEAADKPASASPLEAAPAAPQPTSGGRSASVPAPPWPRRRRTAGFLLGVLALLGLLLLLHPWTWFGRPVPPELVVENFRGTPVLPALVVENSLGMKLRLIPPGQFLRGSDEGEKDREDHEGPRREITITRAFYLGICEVTQRQYETVMGSNPSYFKQQKDGPPHYPVERVTYPMAVLFCERLSVLPAERQAGRVYRLPSEAEWEYACRAGTRTMYHFEGGVNQLGEYAWFDENAGGKSHPVMQKQPNAWGLYDMYGNVWEWCADWYDYAYYRDGPDRDPLCTRPRPKEPGEKDKRVLRGGDWGVFGKANWCRSAARGRNVPNSKLSYHGLRVACNAPGSAP